MATRGIATNLKKFLLKEIPSHPEDIIPFTERGMSVSRTTIHKYLRQLLDEKQIVKSGSTSTVRYFVKSARNKKISLPLIKIKGENEVQRDYLEEDFRELNPSVYEICHYGFTEMLNNVLDHSEGSEVIIETFWKKDYLEILIYDDGVGIFEKIRSAFDLIDNRESVLQLSKGKLTTDPDNHTGEGIFFTSRAFDVFILGANGLTYLKSNEEDDWFVETRSGLSKGGTLVTLRIRFDSKTNLTEDIFKTYAIEDGEDGIPKFNRTHILVQLSKLEEDRYVSRSQAKRILSGLEKFKDICLDFRGVATVGQGFVDEVFRVFQSRHPDIIISYQNASEDVEFMIKRGLPESEPDNQMDLFNEK